MGTRLVVFAAAMFVLVSVASARTWTDSTGKHRLEGEFRTLQDGRVQLIGDDGTLRAIRWEKLSEADQAHVLALTQRPDAPGGDPHRIAAVAIVNRTTAQPEEVEEIMEGPPAAPPIDEELISQASDTSFPKRVFAGSKSTFLLNGFLGTGVFMFPSHPRFITTLVYNSTSPNGFVIYQSIGSVADIDYWAFYEHHYAGCKHNHRCGKCSSGDHLVYYRARAPTPGSAMSPRTKKFRSELCPSDLGRT